jgi:hypothetical protein
MGGFEAKGKEETSYVTSVVLQGQNMEQVMYVRSGEVSVGSICSFDIRVLT